MNTVLPSPGAPIRVAVIGGGQNCEHDIGVATAAAVCAALPGERYTAVPITIGRDGTWHGSDGLPFPDGPAGALRLLSTCHVVFPAVHGPRGEDGALAAWCELAGLPYVGSGVRAGALAMDKHTTKLLARDLGIATARAVCVTRPDGPVPLPLPVVVKPVAAGSSHGVRRVDAPQEYAPAVAAALDLDSRVLVEEFVDGREVDVAVLRQADGTLLVGPALQIVTAPGTLFDTTDKYDGTADFRIPADLTPTERETLKNAALTLFEALGCEGTARFDFFLDGSRIVLNEINTMPGMTAESQVPKMFAAVGLGYAELLTELVEGALRTVR
ncbi:D-alanine--D-alanine ligase [Streptomyces gamaensis]|uniref:D-alanine--D-alanine ligase n=1 Tax=Streptomyces gamaensis TaxID=1763542 RepID=A0ABW0YXX5_9ACTN